MSYLSLRNFAIAVYPLFMHPCIRRCCTFFSLIIAVLSAFSGLLYLIAEHFTILLSERSLTAYFHHSALELLIPVGTMVESKISQLSPLSTVMSYIFMLQAVIFFWVYAIGITPLTHNKWRIIGLILACCFAIGCSFVSDIQNGTHNEFGFYNLGASITFLIGNMVLLATGFAIYHTSRIQYFRYFSLIAGCIGFICIAITMFLPSIFSPLIERTGIYTIMVWEILAGFTIIKRLRKLP